MLLLIDKYDSFTYNVVHYLGELGADVVVRRNDAVTVEEAMAMKPTGIVLAPGPCDPDKAGVCLGLTAAAAATRNPSPQPKPWTKRPPTCGWQSKNMEKIAPDEP